MRFKHSISKRQFDGRITVFIVIFISISLCSRSLPSNEVKGSPTPYGEIYAQAEHTNSSPSSEHVAATPTSSGFSTSNLVSRNVDAVLGNVEDRQPPTPHNPLPPLVRGIKGDRDISLLAQKKVFVFQAIEAPTLLFKPLKKDYFPGDTLTVELSVIKNAKLMQNSSILVEVNSPRGTEMLSIPRKGLELYSLKFSQTDQEGEYTFTVMKTEGYEVAGYQQSTFIRPPSAFQWKLLASIVVSVLAIVGLLVIGANRLLRFTRWYPLSKRAAEEVVSTTPFEPAKEAQQAREEQFTSCFRQSVFPLTEKVEASVPETVRKAHRRQRLSVEEVEEDISTEKERPRKFIKEPPPVERVARNEAITLPRFGEMPTSLQVSSVGAAYPIPDEILVWDEYALVEYIHISEFIQKDGEYSYYFECLNPHNVILNDNHLTKESIVINHNSIVKVNNPLTPFDKGEYKFSFRV